ncbi:unnamed protein product [Sympodiomycopsis kandeliae]
MPCPFAKFAALAAEVDPQQYTKYKNYHSTPPTSSSSSTAETNTSPSNVASSSKISPPLSEYLKTATAKAHREVESSHGVRKLMGFGKQDDDDDFVFGRLDYVRWMIMLGCIYAALEYSLLSQDTTRVSMLGPLLRSRPTSRKESLVSHLLRFPLILDDIQCHLDILAQSSGNEEGAGLTWPELVEESQESHLHGDTSHQQLKQCLASIPQHSLLSQRLASSTLTADHIDLLSSTEAEATLIYTRRLLDLSTSETASELLLSQAYVRYLGDLSGGQHIRRRVERLFPVSSAEGGDIGFSFYAFKKPSTASGSESAWHHTLKNSFRESMDSAIDEVIGNVPESSQSHLAAHHFDLQGQEASLSFELNKDLFEAIVGNRPTTKIPSLPAALPSMSTSTTIPKASSGCPVDATLQFLASLRSLTSPSPVDGTDTKILLCGLAPSHILPVTVLGLAILIGGTSIALHSL